MPEVVRTKFCYFIYDNKENEAHYTPMQKTAALCVWYYCDVCGSGHAGYFDNWKNVDKDTLAKALRTIGALEFADNLIEAVEYGQKDKYSKADTWFGENLETLFIAIEKYLLNNASAFYEIVDEDYTMRHSGSMFWIGFVGTVIFLPLTVFFVATGTNDTLSLIVGSLAANVLGVFFVMCKKIRKITVKKDVFTVYAPFCRAREYQLNEISKVCQTQQGLVVYIDDRKAFEVDSKISNYKMFYAQLREDGKVK